MNWSKRISTAGLTLSMLATMLGCSDTAAKIAEITAFAKRIKRTRSELMVNATLDYIHANA